MGSLKHWYKRSPFWEGVNSTFDLLGVSGISTDDLKEIISEERRYNAILENFLIVRKGLESRLIGYGQEFKEDKRSYR